MSQELTINCYKNFIHEKLLVEKYNFKRVWDGNHRIYYLMHEDPSLFPQDQVLDKHLNNSHFATYLPRNKKAYWAVYYICKALFNRLYSDKTQKSFEEIVPLKEPDHICDNYVRFLTKHRDEIFTPENMSRIIDKVIDGKKDMDMEKIAFMYLKGLGYSIRETTPEENRLGYDMILTHKGKQFGIQVKNLFKYDVSRSDNGDFKIEIESKADFKANHHLEYPLIYFFMNKEKEYTIFPKKEIKEHVETNNKHYMKLGKRIFTKKYVDNNLTNESFGNVTEYMSFILDSDSQDSGQNPPDSSSHCLLELL